MALRTHWGLLTANPEIYFFSNLTLKVLYLLTAVDANVIKKKKKKKKKGYEVHYESLLNVLRLLSWVFDTNRVCHVWCNFIPGYTYRTTVIFGTLKDGSLEINSLALNYYFTCRNVLQSGVTALSKMILKKLGFFFHKAQNFV